MNPDEIDRISLTIPINSLLWILPFVAPMSVAQFEKTSSFVMPRSFADPRAVSRAKASTTRGEAIKSCSREPSTGLGIVGPEKFQAKPALLRFLSQAASVLHAVSYTHLTLPTILLV
mgnify:CR=1 FL=1